MSAPPPELLDRSLKLLQGAIRASGYTQTEVDDRIARRRGYLSHVFQRRVDLKLVDLLRALHALGIEPRQFFRATATGRSGGDQVLQLLADRLPAGAGRASGSAGAGGESKVLQDQVRKALRAILVEAGGEPPKS